MKLTLHMVYTCKYCGRQFDCEEDCRDHEAECRVRTCPTCHGDKTICLGYRRGAYIGFGCFEKVKIIKECPECHGEGVIYI